MGKRNKGICISEDSVDIKKKKINALQSESHKTESVSPKKQKKERRCPTAESDVKIEDSRIVQELQTANSSEIDMKLSDECDVSNKAKKTDSNTGIKKKKRKAIKSESNIIEVVSPRRQDNDVKIENSRKAQELQTASSSQINKKSLAKCDIPNNAKKKVFNNDDCSTQEVLFTNQSSIKSNKKNKNKINDEEADIKDEDIDKFCDELDEEDNVHYENWVKLVEAQLHSNKKK